MSNKDTNNENTGILQNIESDTAQVAQALMPYLTGGDITAERKARYLSFRACGFTITEALELSNTGRTTRNRYLAEDEEFRKADSTGLPALRKKVHSELLNLEFIRNYRMILLKDYKVIKKSILKPDTMTAAENTYLNKARQHYTPQQLAILEQLFAPGEDDDAGMPKSYSDFIFRIRQTKELEIRASQQEV
jgi:hypothetical protein